MSSAPYPAIGVMLPRDLPPDRVRAFAQETERLGFDELWVVEDLGFSGGIAAASAVLAWTEQLRVGIGILPAGARNAVFAAMEIATLARLFPGRVDAGIGHGMPDWMRAAGAWNEKPLRTLEAHVREVRTLLTGGLTDGGVQLDESAIPTEVPPLLLGVRGPRSLALSGRIADGTVLAEPVTPEYARAALDRIDAGSGVTLSPHRLVAYNVGAVDDDEALALDIARPALEWIGEPDWAPHLAPLPFADEFAAFRAASASREEFARGLPDEWVAQLALAGTPEQVRSRIAELAASGVDSSVFIPAGPDPFEALRSLARVL